LDSYSAKFKNTIRVAKRKRKNKIVKNGLFLSWEMHNPHIGDYEHKLTSINKQIEDDTR